MRTSTQAAVTGAFLVCMWLAGAPAAAAQDNLGLVGIRSAWGAYLHAQPDGVLHASNTTRGAEETWSLIRVNGPKKLYAIYNWQNGRFLSKKGHCALAVATVLGPTEQWRLESGKPYGVVNAVIFRSVADDTILKAHNPRHTSDCGGEVMAQDRLGLGRLKILKIPVRDSGWGGWWVLEPATPPAQGQEVWNRVGGKFGDIANQIQPANVAVLLDALS